MSKHCFLWLSILGLAGFPILRGQTQVDLRTQSKSVDFTSAPSTKPVKAGTVLPATCTVASLFFQTAAPAGANLYACTATNTWTVEAGGSGGAFSSAAGAPSGACTLGSIYFDTANADTWFCESPSGWKKVLTTTDAGPFLMTGQNGTAPVAPATGNTSLFFSSTAKLGQSIDDTGSAATMVRAADCSGTGQFLQTVNPDGTLLCAALPPKPLPAVTYNFPAGAGSHASPQPGVWWQDGSSTVVCPTGTPFQCALQWNSGANLLAVTTAVPLSWTGGAVSVSLKYQGDGTGNTVQPAVASGCASDGGTFAFNTAQNFASHATSGTNYSITTLPALTMTGCASGSILVLEFSRVDTAGLLNLAEASITFNIP